MSFIYDMADTWNAIGTTFNAIKMNISNGAGGAPVGAAASRALLLQANGTTIFDVDINGIVTFNGPSSATGTLKTEIVNGFSAFTFTSDAGQILMQFRNTDGGNIAIGAGYFGWGSTSTGVGTPNPKLFKDSDGIVAQRNGSLGQVFRSYGVVRVATSTSLTLASLSASMIGAVSAGFGAMAYIYDGNVPIQYTTVAGGGTTPLIIYSDGVQYRAA